MSLWDVFFSGIFFENLFIWHAVGLGMIVLFSYTMEEAIWVSIRFIIFLIIQTALLILMRPWFEGLGRELLLLLALISTEILMSIFIDIILPNSHLENNLSGFIRRGDAMLPLVLAAIISKQAPINETIIYSLGLGLGVIIVLCAITAISIRFNFHRLHPKHQSALKLIILGILSSVSY